MTSVSDCHFCNVVNSYTPSQIIYECSDLIAFPSFDPIREAHTLIVTKDHFDYFDDLPISISHKIITIAMSNWHSNFSALIISRSKNTILSFYY